MGKRIEQFDLQKIENKMGEDRKDVEKYDNNKGIKRYNITKIAWEPFSEEEEKLFIESHFKHVGKIVREMDRRLKESYANSFKTFIGG